MTTMAIQEAITEHAGVPELEFWSGVAVAWSELAEIEAEEGNVALTEFYLDMVVSAVYMLTLLTD